MYSTHFWTVFILNSFQGNGQLYAYEVATEEPYLFPLATTKFSSPSQGFAFLPKYLCDVKEVEFAKAYRLTQTTVEPVSFTIPRVRVGILQGGGGGDITVYCPQIVVFRFFKTMGTFISF